ncbi:helix-turn-helix domain-containing protein [Streptomyces sp. NPDC015127]|uniref:helix-turn-helix domain-containing protein n=1 Tax=Streptomyces sp. NPDC015127 TaxID=3364939 RepID=UPI003702D629
MSNIVDPLVGQIAARVRAERERRRWTLAQLADASGVSRAMINRIERGESSPTAVVLGKLSAAFQLSVSSLLALAEGSAGDDDAPGATSADGDKAGVRRQAAAAEWRDPATGYRRRQITGPHFPAEIAEIELPAGARVPYPAAAFAFVRQVVWVLDGRLTFHEGDTVHELAAGDTIELGDPAPCVFANTSGEACRYAVVLTRGERP